ncbi:MAG: hypothetical protein LBM93_13015 [Oscillospiraceae bacterium]|nr:hypothetical protein [Oscillospiraceae bacterium]
MGLFKSKAERQLLKQQQLKLEQEARERAEKYFIESEKERQYRRTFANYAAIIGIPACKKILMLKHDLEEEYVSDDRLWKWMREIKAEKLKEYNSETWNCYNLEYSGLWTFVKLMTGKHYWYVYPNCCVVHKINDTHRWNEEDLENFLVSNYSVEGISKYIERNFKKNNVIHQEGLSLGKEFVNETIKSIRKNVGDKLLYNPEFETNCRDVPLFFHSYIINEAQNILAETIIESLYIKYGAAFSAFIWSFSFIYYSEIILNFKLMSPILTAFYNNEIKLENSLMQKIDKIDKIYESHLKREHDSENEKIQQELEKELLEVEKNKEYYKYRSPGVNDRANGIDAALHDHDSYVNTDWSSHYEYAKQRWTGENDEFYRGFADQRSGES